MPGRRSLLPVVAVTLVGAAACTSIAGLGGDFEVDAGHATVEGGTSTSSSSASSSSGVSTSSSSSSTSSSTSSSSSSGMSSTGGIDPDAGVADSGAEAAPTSDGGIPQTDFCSHPYLANEIFCWDFNDNGDAKGDYGATGEYTSANPASLIEITAPSGADSNALHVKHVSSGTTSDGNALLWTENAAATHLSYALQFYFRVNDAHDYTVIGAIQINGTEYGIATVATDLQCSNSKNPCLVQNAPGKNGVLNGAKSIAIDKVWHFGEVDLTWNGGTNAWDGTISIDGTQIDSKPGALLFDTKFPTQYIVLLGAFYSGGSGDNLAVDVDIDNWRLFATKP